MSCVNQVILLGNLGADPVLRVTSAGRNLATFSVATSRNWQNDEGEWQQQTNWHRVVVWGERAQTVSDRMAKGNRVYVEGRLQSRSWEDERGERRTLTEVHARRVYQLSPALAHEAAGEPIDGAGDEPAAETDAAPGNGNDSAPAAEPADDVPF